MVTKETGFYKSKTGFYIKIGRFYVDKNYVMTTPDEKSYFMIGFCDKDPHNVVDDVWRYSKFVHTTGSTDRKFSKRNKYYKK